MISAEQGLTYSRLWKVFNVKKIIIKGVKMGLNIQVSSVNVGKYIPGVCNIGPDEIRKRRNGALYSGLIMVIILILFPVLEVNRIWRLVVFLPAAAFGIGILQWQLKFCAGFGMKGVFNFGKIGKVNTIQEKENLRRDRNKSIRMLIWSILFGLAVAILFYFIPG